MIQAASLINSDLLSDAFGTSKVIETARRLRELELYPSAKTRVTDLQAATLLYCLAASKTVSASYKVAERLPKIKDSNSTPFVEEFARMLENGELMLLIKEISISQETGLVYIICENQIGKSVTNTYMLTGSVEDEVSHFCTLKRGFIRKFVSVIKEKSKYLIQN